MVVCRSGDGHHRARMVHSDGDGLAVVRDLVLPRRSLNALLNRLISHVSLRIQNIDVIDSNKLPASRVLASVSTIGSISILNSWSNTIKQVINKSTPFRYCLSVRGDEVGRKRVAAHDLDDRVLPLDDNGIGSL